MASQKYLDLLKGKQVNPLAYYRGGNHSKATCIYANIVSTQEIKHPTPSRKDAMLTFYVSDPSIPCGSMSVCLFEQDIGKLDFVKEADIIIIQDFRLKLFNGNPQISINRFTKYATFTINPPTLTCNKNYEITSVDEEIINVFEQYLKEHKESSTIDLTIRLPTRRPVLETCEIIDNESKFFDYVGEVLEISIENSRATLSLTDYTLNPLPIRNYVEENIVKKEFIINCTVWDSLANECEDLQPGDYVSLRNCVKKDRNPLEFAIRNNENENKVLLLKIEEDDPRLQKLLERKKNYKMCNLPREFTSVKDIKLEKEPSKFQTQARIVSYKPEDIEKWIRGWCYNCSISSAGGMAYNTNEELKVEAFERSAEDLFFKIPAKS
ncbi:hypothetical protein INT48_007167 [Thamnidium elegans]|uniref:Protection of telomeres protein 1 ssDNA-binding domain-containing protein n=1 Tax=Thamnidium elegans TaxID=101142 RepID=A0A8H7SPH7_9FUNG|nr:hypothetical protein INT48_007167 [Thamnidium elegans]